MNIKNKWQFDKYVTKLELNSYAVVKYINKNTEEIKLVAERHGSKVRGAHDLQFKNHDEYSAWLDKNTNDQDWFYNDANVLDKLLSIMIETWKK